MVFLYILTYFTLEITQFQVSNSTLLIKFQNQTFILKYCFWNLLHFYILISKSVSLYDCAYTDYTCSVSHILHNFFTGRTNISLIIFTVHGHRKKNIVSITASSNHYVRPVGMITVFFCLQTRPDPIKPQCTRRTYV